MNSTNPNQAPRQPMPLGSRTVKRQRFPRPSRKLMRRAGFVVAGAAVLGAAAWAVMTFVFPGVELEPYEGAGATLMVPVGYEQVGSQNGMGFEEPTAEGEQVTSYVSLQVLNYDQTGMNREQSLKAYQDIYTEESLAEALSRGGSNPSRQLRNHNAKTVTQDEADVLEVRYDQYEDETKTASIRVRALFTDEGIYMVSVSAGEENDKLRRSMGRITRSLEPTAE